MRVARRGRGVRFFVLAAATAAAGALVPGVVGPATAAAPRTVRSSVDFSFPDAPLSATCGFPVEFFNVGIFESKLFYDASGAIVREIDTYPSDKVGWRSPATGKAVAISNGAQLTTEYPKGATIGAPIITTGHGISIKLPGYSADAGTVVFAGSVAFVDADGVPIVAFTDILGMTGHSNDPSGYDAAICGALAP